ncbi:MAG: N-acetylmuramoyl-L-alanine amidase [Oscillospiraceae bacterium]|nr:N-acetylmuramoyl-L-alanine amidase [Oscillospiraceae bacterium]
MGEYITRHITKNPAYGKNLNTTDQRYLNFQKIGPQGAVLHSIGTPQPSGKIIADYFDSPDVEASVHMVLEADGSCYELAPLNFRMWHVGGSANNTHLGIEMTEPDCISYDAEHGYKLTVYDHEKALDHVQKTYWAAVHLFARLCTAFRWDALKDGVILSHKECYERGIGSNHGDPEHLWEALSTGFTMDGFRKDVAHRMEQLALLEPIEELLTPLEEQISALKQRVEALEKTLSDHLKSPVEGRFPTMGDLMASPNYPYYLPTVQKLLTMGVLHGKGGSGEDLYLDLGEDAIRVLVLLDRMSLFDF